MNEVCMHGAEAPVAMLKELHDAQGGRARHKSVVYEYERDEMDSGKEILALGHFETCPHGNIAPISLLNACKRSDG